jgi:hypothetical protein
MVWPGTRDEAQDFPWFKTLFKRPLTEFLSSNTSKFEMPPIRKVVSLEMMNNFWPISKYLGEIWRKRQKFQKQAWTLGDLTGV